VRISRLIAVVECGGAIGGAITICLIRSVGGPIAGGAMALLSGMLVGLIPGGIGGVMAALIVRYGFARFAKEQGAILWVAFLASVIAGGLGTHLFFRLLAGAAGLGW
jgi:hypothetical protein